jgi:hypothetical protein
LATDRWAVRRITYVNTWVLTGDEFGELLLDYAAALAKAGLSEPLRFAGIGSQGDDEHISFIVGPASQIVVESVRSQREAPENLEQVAYMRTRIAQLADPRPAVQQGERPSSSRTHELHEL